MMERKYVSREEMEEFLPGFSDDDDDDEEDFIVDVNFCPFCGFSHLPFMDDNMNI